MDDDQPSKPMMEEKTLVDGLDFYFENGLMVLTQKYLLDRRFCCKNGCRHCPYEENVTDSE